MKDQKAYHQRKLAIIEMIEECEGRIDRENEFRFRNSEYWGLSFNENSLNNINRYERIKHRLMKWLSESNNRN